MECSRLYEKYKRAEHRGHDNMHTARTTGRRPATRIALCAIAAVASVGLVACGDDEDEAADTLAAVKEKGFATFGLEAQYEPFGFRDADNNIVGYDIDLGNAIGEIIGVEMPYRPIASLRTPCGSGVIETSRCRASRARSRRLRRP